MFTNFTNDQGVVFKKTHKQYHIRSQRGTIACVLASHLYKSDPDLTIAVGDLVRFSATSSNSGTIFDVLPRQNKFSRPAPKPGMRKIEQVIAANIDQIVPVFSTANPTPKWRLLDRYLVAAEAARIPAVICISKLDLKPNQKDWQLFIEVYQEIGYQVICVSTYTNEGFPELRNAFQNRISILVGKSGVGKTSLLNALRPELGLRVQDVIPGKKSRGRHTTTYLEMFSLDSRGFIVDTPGIREFSLWDISPDELAWCFPEMRPFLNQCKFRSNCLHIEEPSCAVRKAVMDSKISPYRYQSYTLLQEELI